MSASSRAPMRRVVVAPSRLEYAATAARVLQAELSEEMTSLGRVRLVLAGGSTPAAVYRRLAKETATDVDWERVSIFFGDERCVDSDDEASNFRMASESLGAAFTRAEVFRIHGELGPHEGAADYDRRLRDAFGGEPPSFNLVILGVGRDGHTASLFSLPKHVPGQLVVATRSPEPPHDRISLEYGALAATRRLVFLACGGDKKDIVSRILSRGARCPASAVHPEGGETTWVLDPDAASGYEHAGIGA